MANFGGIDINIAPPIQLVPIEFRLAPLAEHLRSMNHLFRKMQRCRAQMAILNNQLDTAVIRMQRDAALHRPNPGIDVSILSDVLALFDTYRLWLLDELQSREAFVFDMFGATWDHPGEDDVSCAPPPPSISVTVRNSESDTRGVPTQTTPSDRISNLQLPRTLARKDKVESTQSWEEKLHVAPRDQPEEKTRDVAVQTESSRVFLRAKRRLRKYRQRATRLERNAGEGS